MNLEFRKKLGNFCKDEGLDIIDETDTCVCIDTQLMQFAIEYCIYKGKFYAQCQLMEVYLRGRTYNYYDFSIIIHIKGNCKFFYLYCPYTKFI